jgi:hypothetical protein
MDLRHDKVGTESRSGIKRSSEEQTCVPQKRAQESRRAAEAIVATSKWCRSRWKGRRSYTTQRSERNWTGAFASANGSVCQWPARLDSASACETTGHLPPTVTLPGKLLRHPRNLVIVELFSSPILFTTGNSLSTHSSSQPRLPQGLPWFTESS